MILRHALLPLLCCLAACAHTPTSPPAPDSINSTWEGGIAQDAEAAAGVWWTNFQDPVLDALIDDAQRRNVDLRLAAERVMGSQALRRAARAGLFPEISGEAQLGQTDRGSRASGGNQGGNASLGLSAIWEPDLSGRLSAAVRVASANVVASQADAETVRLLLLQEVASAYVDYRLQRALLRLTERTALAQEGTLRITRDRYAFGMVSSLEVSRGETLVAQTRAEHERAVENAASARYRLAYLLSTTPDDITARLGDGDTIPLANPLQVLASPAAVLERRPDIRAAAARYAAAAGERDIAISARFPLLSLSGLIGVDSGSVSSLFDRGTGIASVLGSLVMPLLDFGRRQADLDAADSTLRQAGLEYEQVTRAALRETQTAIISYIQAQAIEVELRRAAEAAQKAERVSLLQYDSGTLSQFEVLDAARTVYQTERDHATSVADVSARLIALFRALGSAPESPTAPATPLSGDRRAP
ncbi:MAG: efflux transporter outer membrane subunit [Novosphingobium sp.]